MGSGEYIDAASDARQELKAEVYSVVKDLMANEWRLRRQGHKFKLYCPCGAVKLTVNGTPQNAANHAKRLRRLAAHCPDRHDLDGV